MSREPRYRPAPGELELIRAFVNTLDNDKGTDALDHGGAASALLVKAGLLLPGTRVAADDLARILSVREAFRAVLVANAAGGCAREAVSVLNGVATDAKISVRLSGPSTAVPLVAARGIEGAMGRLVALAFDAISANTWIRLKACPADGCHWAFYDASRNRSSRWCDMGVCGNRAKHKTFRRRRRP